MALTSIGQTVYFSSTLKGGDFIYTNVATGLVGTFVSPEISVALDSCKTPKFPAHARGANCGEPLACQMFCRDQANAVFGEDNAFAVTWGRYSQDMDGDGVLKPCEYFNMSIEPWDCDKLLRQIQVSFLERMTCKASISLVYQSNVVRDVKGVPGVLLPANEKSACTS